MIDRFPTESNFQSDLWKEFFPLISLFQLSMHLRNLNLINKRNNYVVEYLWLYSLIQSTTHGVLIEESCIGVGTNIWSFIQDLNKRLYLPLFWPSFWTLIIWPDKFVEVKFTWVIKIISDCWSFLISRLITLTKILAVFCCCYYVHFLTYANFTVTVMPCSYFLSCLWTNICFIFFGRLTQLSVPYLAVRRIWIMIKLKTINILG